MQSQEKIENQLKTQLLFPWRVFTLEAFLFCLTLSLGIVSAKRLNEFLKIQEVPLPTISFWQFLLYFLLATLFIFVSSFLGKRFKKGKVFIFRALFVLTIFWGGALLLNVWIPEPFALILILFLIFWWLKKPSVLIQDICTILGMAGVGSVLGLQIPATIIVLLLIVFSIYDFIAVYKTKHMIKMAKEMIEARAILGLIIPQKISDFKAGLREIEPGGKFLILGGGDVVFPLIFCVSLASQNILNSLIVALFALIGLFIGFWFFISQKVRQPIPALPPIALFSIIGFLITKLI